MDWEAIQFKRADRKSVVLAQHGPGLQPKVDEFLEELTTDDRIVGFRAMPLQVLESKIVMTEFLRWYLLREYETDERVWSGLYLHSSWPDDCSLKVVNLDEWISAREEEQCQGAS